MTQHYLNIALLIVICINGGMTYALYWRLRKIGEVRKELDLLLENATLCNKQSQDQLAALRFVAKHFSDPDEMERFLQENQVRH